MSTPATPMPATSTDEARPSIIVEHVRKQFLLRRAHAFKEAFVGWVRGKDVSSEKFLALDDVSFTIREGESVALLGFNGSGKSTMLKLISGVMEPDEGSVLVRGRLAGLIEVGAGFHPDLTGHENVYLNAAILGMQKDEIDARYDDILAFSEVERFIDQEVKHYSSGMFMRLAFSVAIHCELDILLVDEVLSVGDAPFQDKCRRKINELSDAGKTMVIVSHDADLVRQVCGRGIVIRQGKQVFDGPIEDALKAMHA